MTGGTVSLQSLKSKKYGDRWKTYLQAETTTHTNINAQCIVY